VNERFIPIEREVANLYEPWMFWVFIVALALIALVRIQFPVYAQLVRWNFSNYRIARQAFVENEPLIHTSWLLMLPVMLSGIALFLYLALQGTDAYCLPATFGSFLRIVLIVLGVFILKMLTINLVDTVAAKTAALRIYLGNTFLLVQSVSIVLLLLSAMMALAWGGPSDWMIYSGAGLLGFIYLVRLARGIIAALEERISLNYIILYLCALEFLPLAVLAKAWYLSLTHCH
jgi:hypothetical protein